MGALALATLFLAAPNAALADNECGLQIDPGNPETLTCPPGDYDGTGTNPGPGITYSSDGGLTLQVTDDSDHLDVFETGIDVTGNGGDSVSWDSSAFVNNDIRGTGIVLDYSSNTGAIDLLIGGDVRAQSDGTHAIRAISSSGNVTIQTNEGGRIFGGDYGIQAETGGSGTLDIVVGDSIDIDSATGIAAIDATTGTGLLTIDIVSTSSQDQINGQSGSAILINAGGNAVINVGDGRSVTNAFGADEVVMDLTAVGETVVNNEGQIRPSSSTVVVIRADGDTFILNNDGIVEGFIDFSELASGYTFNNNAGATWDAAFGGGQTGDLGAGEFNNAGTIELSRANFISAPGTTFTGIGDGTLEMGGVILDGQSQLDCMAPTVASCLDLSGGTTAGQTSILVDAANSNPDPFAEVIDTPLNPGIVLVDVGGGTSAANHFVLDPGSENYAADSVYGGVIDTEGRGLFDYALLYNPNTQQHLLASVPQHEALEYAALIHESLSVWHTTSDAVAGRQADLRDGGQRGGWIRAFTGQTERDFTPAVTTHGNTFNYDRSYTLDTRGAVAGYDLTADNSHVLGVHLGFLATRLDHDDSQTKDETTFPSSVTFGAYGGWWNETGLTLDGTLNVNLLDIEHNVRSGLEDTRANVFTAGIRGEAGWRFPMAESFYVQPHVVAAYAYADVEKLEMRDYDAKFEDEQSMRAALGVRLGGGTDLTGDRFSRVKYWLTARAWEEYAEDGNVQFAVQGGDPLVIEDDISEGFEEVGLGVSLTSPDENLEVFLSGNIRSGDQTDGNNVTIGARMNW